MTEFWIEFNRMCVTKKVPAAELDDARHAGVAGFALSLEHPDQLLNFAEEQEIYGLPADYWDTIIRRRRFPLVSAGRCATRFTEVYRPGDDAGGGSW